MQNDTNLAVDSEYLRIEHESVMYSSSYPIPLNLSQPHGIYSMRVVAFCLTSCHGYDELCLRIQPVIQNQVRSPARARFGLIQTQCVSHFPFVTRPFSLGRVYEWTRTGWTYRH